MLTDPSNWYWTSILNYHYSIKLYTTVVLAVSFVLSNLFYGSTFTFVFIKYCRQVNIDAVKLYLHEGIDISTHCRIFTLVERHEI